MNRHFLIILLAFAATVVRAQSTKPDILNAMGGSATIGGNEFDYSIGEMSVVSTYSTASIIVTQGLLQPAPTTNTGHEQVVDTKFAQHLQVFPNPASSVVHIQYNAAIAGELSCKLMDMAGKIVSKQTVSIHAGANTQEVSVDGLPCATYMLDVTMASAAGQEHASYKIQKIK